MLVEWCSIWKCLQFNVWIRESCEKGEDLCDASWNLCICEAEEKHVPVSPTRLLHRLPNPFIFTWSLFSLFTPPPSREHFANTLPSCIHQGLLNTTCRQYILISNALFVFERKTSELSHFVPKFICMTFPHAPKNSCMHISISSLLAGIDEILDPGVSGKGFWLPGTGTEIENPFLVLREGNGN